MEIIYEKNRYLFALHGCPELADDIGAFLDALGLSRAVLIGYSFGGLVTQHFAARHPGRVRVLVLSNMGPLRRTARFFPRPYRATSMPPM